MEWFKCRLHVVYLADILKPHPFYPSPDIHPALSEDLTAPTLRERSNAPHICLSDGPRARNDDLGGKVYTLACGKLMADIRAEAFTQSNLQL